MSTFVVEYGLWKLQSQSYDPKPSTFVELVTNTTTNDCVVAYLLCKARVAAVSFKLGRIPTALGPPTEGEGVACTASAPLISK